MSLVDKMYIGFSAGSSRWASMDLTRDEMQELADFICSKLDEPPDVSERLEVLIECVLSSTRTSLEHIENALNTIRMRKGVKTK